MIQKIENLPKITGGAEEEADIVTDTGECLKILSPEEIRVARNLAVEREAEAKGRKVAAKDLKDSKFGGDSFVLDKEVVDGDAADGKKESGPKITTFEQYHKFSDGRREKLYFIVEEDDKGCKFAWCGLTPAQRDRFREHKFNQAQVAENGEYLPVRPLDYFLNELNEFEGQNSKNRSNEHISVQEKGKKGEGFGTWFAKNVLGKR